MFCHETYKDKNGNWVSPDELISIDGKKYLEKDKSKEIIVGPSESMSKSKKYNRPEKIINNYGADSARLFILSDSLKKMYNGLTEKFSIIQIYSEIMER